MEYSSADLYIECDNDKRKIVKRINCIIDALLKVALKAAASDNITEYNLDDGQVKIKTLYRGADQVYVAIEKYRKLKQAYVNEINGRTFRMVDSKNFKGR